MKPHRGREFNQSGAKAGQKGAGRVISCVLAAAGLFGVGALGACGFGDDENRVDHTGYALHAPAVTTNVASLEGWSSGQEALVARVNPGVFGIGPEGQLVPNRDLATAVALPSPDTVIRYTIAPQARFSDGEQVTCEDFAQGFYARRLAPLFRSAQDLFDQVDHIDCAPGAKEFVVAFTPGFGERWRHLFSAGTVLPFHAMARAAGLNPQLAWEALTSMDPEVGYDAVTGTDVPARALAAQWNGGFLLGNFRNDLQLSYGPYRIASVEPDGRVLLVANEIFAGDQPSFPNVALYPSTFDIPAALAEEGIRTDDLDAADYTSLASASWVNRDDPKNPFDLAAQAGSLSEQLVLAREGIFEDPALRAAFAACVDQAAVAKASSDISGVTALPLYTRIVGADTPHAQLFQGITDVHRNVDIDRARALEGQTIRIGYNGENPRYAAMVQAIARSCAPAGITVVDAHEAGSNLGALASLPPIDAPLAPAPALPMDVPEQAGEGEQTPPAPSEVPYDAPLPELNAPGEDVPAAIDAFLLAFNPAYCFPTVRGDVTDVENMVREEYQLWDEVATIPLAVQPRVFVTRKSLDNLVANTSMSGLGWNLDRWQEKPSQ